MHRDNTERIQRHTDLANLETRLWQVGFRLIYGRDHEFYALPVHGSDSRHAVRISPLVSACRWGHMTVGGVAAACCRLIGLPEFEPVALDDLGNDA